MKTAIDKNESRFDKMKRQAEEWLGRFGMTAPPFLHLALREFKSTPIEQKESKRSAEEIKQQLAEANKESTWKGHSQGYYYHFIEGWEACENYAQQPQKSKKELKDIYKLAHKYNFDDFVQFMNIEQPQKFEQKERESTEEIDLIQYVTNLLYAAKDWDGYGFNTWVEEQIKLLEEYAAQSRQPEITDEEIEDEADRQYGESTVIPEVAFIAGAKWMRDKLEGNE
jgi:hypothetical protein